MKKLLVILLGFCFAMPAFAGTLGAVSNEAWLDHVAQMQSLRQQILSLVTKNNPTIEDRQNLELLNLTFAERKAEWDKYLEDVAQGKQSVSTQETAKPLCEEKTGKKPWARYNKKAHRHHKNAHKGCGKGKCEEMCKDGCKGFCKEECKGLSPEECKKACAHKMAHKACRKGKCEEMCKDGCKGFCKEECKGLSPEECKKACAHKMQGKKRAHKKAHKCGQKQGCMSNAKEKCLDACEDVSKKACEEKCKDAGKSCK